MESPSTHHVARLDPALRVTVVRTVAMRYAGGADAAEDRPAHVRAGSGVAFHDDTLVVVQDDAHFLAFVDPGSGIARAVALPALDGLRLFGDDRGNKSLKWDLESALVVDRVLYAFGSGSTPRRNRVALLPLADTTPTLVEARALYHAFQTRDDFAGSELNIEGAALADHATLRFFQRGNGAPRAGRRPVNGTADLPLADVIDYLHAAARDPDAPLPAKPGRVRTYSLGAVGGVALSFTDGAAVPGHDAVAYLAAAEDSPDATRDGPCAGVALGLIAPDGEARYALLRDAHGDPFDRKAEGLTFHPTRAGVAYAVVDLDDPHAPSLLCELRVEP